MAEFCEPCHRRGFKALATKKIGEEWFCPACLAGGDPNRPFGIEIEVIDASQIPPQRYLTRRHPLRAVIERLKDLPAKKEFRLHLPDGRKPEPIMHALYHQASKHFGLRIRCRLDGDLHYVWRA